MISLISNFIKAIFYHFFAKIHPSCIFKHHHKKHIFHVLHHAIIRTKNVSPPQTKKSTPSEAHPPAGRKPITCPQAYEAHEAYEAYEVQFHAAFSESGTLRSLILAFLIASRLGLRRGYDGVSPHAPPEGVTPSDSLLRFAPA